MTLAVALAIPRLASRQLSPRRRPSRTSPTLHSARHSSTRKTDETSRSESDDPVCRPIRRLLFPASLFRLSFHSPARPNLWKRSSGRSRLRGTVVSGRFRARKLVGSNRYSKCFFAGAQCPAIMALSRFRSRLSGRRGRVAYPTGRYVDGRTQAPLAKIARRRRRLGRRPTRPPKPRRV